MSTVAELQKAAMLSLLICALSTTVLPAQASKAAKPVMLMVRPHVGDTLWMHLEQTMETRSVPLPRTAGEGSATGTIGTRTPTAPQPAYGPIEDRSITQSVVMRMQAHTLVEASTLKSTALEVITDSLHVRTGALGKLGSERPVYLAPADRRTRVSVTPEGAMSVRGPMSGTTTLAAGLAGMPPMLPSRAVSVGDEWERDVPLPSLAITGVRTDGVVHARFKLDSIARDGRYAFVSMKGTLRRKGAVRDLPPGTQVVTAGVLHGSFTLDRTRGWITEAETFIEVQSEVTQRAGSKASARALEIHLEQRMRVR